MARAPSEQRAFLSSVLERACVRDAPRAPVVVADLDSTLYDNRPRERAILREWADTEGRAHPKAAERIRAIPLRRYAYDVADTLRAAGVRDRAVIQRVVSFWQDRFFTDRYCQIDVPTPGAVELVGELHDAGAFVVYLTGRDAPGMLVGTTISLRRDGFPVGVAGTTLLMKPDFATPDTVFKAGVLDRVAEIGDPIAAFDNEPEHCNLYAARWPGCRVALLDTMCSPGAPKLRDGVVVLRSFRR